MLILCCISFYLMLFKILDSCIQALVLQLWMYFVYLEMFLNYDCRDSYISQCSWMFGNGHGGGGRGLSGRKRKLTRTARQMIVHGGTQSAFLYVPSLIFFFRMLCRDLDLDGPKRCWRKGGFSMFAIKRLQGSPMSFCHLRVSECLCHQEAIMVFSGDSKCIAAV